MIEGSTVLMRPAIQTPGRASGFWKIEVPKVVKVFMWIVEDLSSCTADKSKFV
jgi:hypothetical protein